MCERLLETSIFFLLIATNSTTQEFSMRRMCWPWKLYRRVRFAGTCSSGVTTFLPIFLKKNIKISRHFRLTESHFEMIEKRWNNHRINYKIMRCNELQLILEIFMNRRRLTCLNNPKWCVEWVEITHKLASVSVAQNYLVLVRLLSKLSLAFLRSIPVRILQLCHLEILYFNTTWTYSRHRTYFTQYHERQQHLWRPHRKLVI